MSELYVFDTNALISAALLKHSVSRRALDKAQQLGQLLLSVETLNELNEVLKRDKFNKYVTEDERMMFLAALVGEAKIVEIHEQITVCRDPKDDKFLELAVAGGAQCIITGDKDLLVLHPFRDVTIVRPDVFLKEWG